MLRRCCSRKTLASTSGIAHAPTIRIARREDVNNNIATAETANPIHDARVTVIPNVNTSPATASSSYTFIKLRFCFNARKIPSASAVISCNTSAYVTQ